MCTVVDTPDQAAPERGRSASGFPCWYECDVRNEHATYRLHALSMLVRADDQGSKVTLGQGVSNTFAQLFARRRTC